MPFADVGPLKIESDLTDEQVLFLSDILPTGYMGAEMCDIKPGDMIAVWGAGPSASSPSRARCCSAPSASSPSTASPTGCRWRARRRAPRRINYEETDVLEALKELTGGRGPDACIDAVGMEAHTASASSTPTTASSKPCAWRPTGPIALRAGDHWPAATAASSRSSACTAASSTSSPWAR